MSNPPDRAPIKAYFGKRLQEHGATPEGADWNSEAAQNVRFDQLLKVTDSHAGSILDYGCGYGALADYLAEKGFQAEYYGFDILESALEVARTLHAGQPDRIFLGETEQLPVCDYTVASGVFNVRGAASAEDWTDYVITELHRFDVLSRKGFASNFLTSYSDPERMRVDLYYADPLRIFDYCKRHFSRNVALLHDYEIYDFTIIVRKH
jgi:SAM-dependent methyltransferase